MYIPPGIKVEMAKRLASIYRRTNHPMGRIIASSKRDPIDYIVDIIDRLMRDWDGKGTMSTAGIVIEGGELPEVHFQESLGFMDSQGDWYMYDE